MFAKIKRIYDAFFVCIAIVLLLCIFTKAWSIFAVKVSVRLYHGEKAKWKQLHIVTNLSVGNLGLQSIIYSIYDLATEPLSVSTFSRQDCILNKCQADLIIGDSLDFMEKESINIKFAKWNDKSLEKMEMVNGTINENSTIVGIPILHDLIYLAVDSKSHNVNIANKVVHDCIEDEYNYKEKEIQKIISLMEEKRKRATEKKESMSEKIASHISAIRQNRQQKRIQRNLFGF